MSDRTCVESPKQAAEIKTKHAVSIMSQAVFHDFPDIAGLEESMKQQDRFGELREITPTDNPVSAQINTTYTAELVSGEMVHTVDHSGSFAKDLTWCPTHCWQHHLAADRAGVEKLILEGWYVIGTIFQARSAGHLRRLSNEKLSGYRRYRRKPG